MEIITELEASVDFILVIMNILQSYITVESSFIVNI